MHLSAMIFGPAVEVRHAAIRSTTHPVVLAFGEPAKSAPTNDAVLVFVDVDTAKRLRDQLASLLLAMAVDKESA